MATLNLTIKDSVLLATTEAVAAMGGWTDTVVDPADPLLTIPNPITKDLFLKKQIKAWLRNQTLEHANRVALAGVVIEEDV